jgi:hypothetical protein
MKIIITRSKITHLLLSVKNYVEINQIVLQIYINIRYINNLFIKLK